MRHILQLATTILAFSMFITACNAADEDNQASLIAPENQPVHSPVPTLSTTQIVVSPENLTGATSDMLTVLDSPSDTFYLTSNNVRGVIWSPSGEQFAVHCAQGIWLYETEHLDNPAQLLSITTTTTPPAFSLDGQLIAVIGADARITVWDTTSGQVISSFEGPQHLGQVLAISPDNQTLALLDNARIHVWDIHSTYAYQSLPLPDHRIFDMATGDLTTMLHEHRSSIVELAYSSSRDYLISTDSHQNTWRGETKIAIPGVHMGLASTVDAQNLIWAFSDRSSSVIRLWTPEDQGYGKYIFATHDIYSLRFSPDGQWLASGGKNGIITLWDPTTREQVNTLNGHTGVVTGLRFAQNATRLVSWSTDAPVSSDIAPDYTLQVWDLESGENLYILDVDLELFSAIVLSSDGEFLALASKENPIVQAWQLSTNTISARLEADSIITSLEFVPNSSILVSGHIDGLVSLWPVDQDR